MSALADTNILLRLTQTHHAQHPTALEALARLRREGETIHIVPQCAYEFWVVCTRPSGENGLGLTVTEANAELAKVKAIFPMLGDVESIYSEWERLVVTYQVAGKSAHDARLVAAMIVHKIGKILSFNHGDFQRYPEITALSPNEVAASAAS